MSTPASLLEALQLPLQFLTSLAIGLLLGLERERHTTAKAGLRTCALVSLFGSVCGLLAQTTAARSPSIPDVPTYKEAGIAMTLDQWLGVFVPAGTPPAITARLNSEMNKALQDAAVKKVFTDSAQEPVGGTADQFSKLVHEDFGKYDKLVRDLNIKVTN